MCGGFSKKLSERTFSESLLDSRPFPHEILVRTAMSAPEMSFPSPPTLPAIEAWLECLPVSNVRESCRVLYAGLQALNAAPPGIAPYFDALEKIRPLVGKLSRNLAPVFLGKPFPLEEKSRKVAKLGGQFHAELGAGYQAIANDPAFVEAFGPEVRGRVLYRALRAFEVFYMRLALIHEVPSSRLWDNVNALYRQAESLDLLSASAELAHDISAVFARMQVARLVAPNRMRQADCEWVFELLKQSGELIGLSASPEGCGGADYWLDLESPKPPRACALGPARGRVLRFLTVRPLLSRIATLSQLSASLEEFIEEPLATYLQVRLGGLPDVAAEQKSRDVSLVEGFDALYDAVVGMQAWGGDGGWNGGLAGLEIVPLNDHVGFSAGAEGSKSAGTFVSSSTRGAGLGMVVEIPHERGEGRLFCRVRRSDTAGFYLLEPAHRSANCYGLVGLNTDNKLVQAGLAHPNTRPGAGATALTFELLQRESEAVRLRCDGSHLEVRKALWGQSAGEETMTLITLPLRLKNGEGVTVERRGRHDRYRVARMLETSDEFVQFEIVPEVS